MHALSGPLGISREVEVADGVGDLGAGIGEPFEMFEKEDMSDMFKRAMLEKMQTLGENITNQKDNFHQFLFFR